jgi:hypothetical protein
MRKPQGYAAIVEPGHAIREADTVMCVHCGVVVFVGAGKDPSDLGGFCMMCNRNTCSKCAATGKCEPFEKKLERIERRGQLLRAAGV